MKQTLLIIGFVVLATHTYQVSAQSPLDIYWREEAISPNWSEGADPCEEIGIIASQWWYPHFDPNNSRNAPNCYGTYNLVFNNNHETVLFNNISFVEVNRITFASGATTGRTINGNGIDLRAPDLDAPRINNLSSAAHTFNVDLALHHNPVEFNPVDADLSLSGNIFTNGNYIDVYGDNGNSLFISGNISGGGGLTIKQNSTVVIEADQTYSGFTTIEDGILELKSSLASSAVTVNNETLLRINGNNVEIASLTIQSGGLVVIEPGMSLTVNGTLNNNAGNSGLVIKSDATGTGTLIHNNTGVNGTAERHIAGFTSSTSGWHFLSSPVSAQPISDFHTAGSGNDFYKWDEPSGEWINRTVTGGGLNGSFETNFAVGAGYLIANGNTSTKEFSGTLNVSDVPVTGLTNTGSSTHQGWHLLGNPFSSAIKFNQGTWAKTNIGGLAQIWNESTASYKVLAGNQIIPAHNGFMVYTTGSGSLTIPADARLHSDSTWYKNAVTGNEIILIAHDPEGQTAQETIISFNPDATEDFDLQYDSYYLSGFAPNFYSISQNQLFALNAIPPITENLEIQLGFIKNQSSSFTIELLQTIDDQTLYLTDQKTDYTHKLSDGPYHFTSTAGDDPNRFLLRFSAVGIEDVSPVLSDHVWVYKNNLLVNNVQGSIYVEIFDLMGRRVHNAQMAGDGLSTMYLDQPAGVYVVKISTNSGVHTIKATLTN